jgi:LmbE family N-acetylglucosaminyl deacetylase
LLPIVAALAAALICAVAASAQSMPETVEAIQKARIATRILYITAHPDDESTGMLTYLSRALDADVALLTVTRGQGGQNAIGPEQDGELGVVRTTELLGAGSLYGVHQYFTRAVDPGFSKDPVRTMKIWGNVIPMEDMVRVIRTYRPQIVINGWGGVHSGHGQHQAVGLLTPEAVLEAADPTKFPDQIAEGLPAWKVALELRQGRDSSTGGVLLSANDVSPLWGKSYTDLGTEGHALQRSQGTPSFFGNAFFRRPIYLITENAKDETGTFDAKLLAQGLANVASRFPHLQATMEPALTSADKSIEDAARSAMSLDRTVAAKSLADAGKTLMDLREKLSASKDDQSAEALWELDDIRQRLDLALTDDIALPMGNQADRHELVAGESFSVNVIFAGKPAVPVTWKLNESSFVLPDGWHVAQQPPPARAVEGNTRFSISIPDGATPPSRPGDVILPFVPPLVKLALQTEVNGYQFLVTQPVVSQAETTVGIDTYQLELVPAVTLTVEPAQIMVPLQHAAAPITLFARVRYHGTHSTKVSVGLDAPSGWNVSANTPLDFSAPSDQLIRYEVTPPAHVAAGAYTLHPYGQIGQETFRTSLEPIPTLPTRDWSGPDDANVHVLNLVVPAGLHVGYVSVDTDPMPAALRQIGIQVDELDERALAFNDLNHYDAIVVGIRAYELRPDLPRMNWRVLDYVKDGGTLLVQYQRDFAWNKLLPAPFGPKMADQAARVTDADSPVRFLAPENPLLNSPNKITMADFQGWVQERGLYFWQTFGSPYEAVLGLTDAGESETNGGLVYGKVGKGVYIYTGLSFFRQLPEGVPGAYRLFVNLLSQTRHSPVRN